MTLAIEVGPTGAGGSRDLLRVLDEQTMQARRLHENRQQRERHANMSDRASRSSQPSDQMANRGADFLRQSNGCPAQATPVLQGPGFRLRQAHRASAILEKSPILTRVFARKRDRLSGIPIFVCVSMLSACASFTPQEVVDPKEVTVSEALQDIGKGFIKMDTALGGRVLGLYPCEVKVTLNLKASAKESGKLVIGLASKPRVLEGHSNPTDPAAKADIEQTAEAAAERGNTIDLRMYNPACLPTGTLGYEKPGDLGKARRGMAFTENERHLLNLYQNLDIEKWQQIIRNQETNDPDKTSTGNQ